MRCSKWLILDLQMKRSKATVFIVVSSLALMIVLIIQVNWIMQTAKIKEEIFNDKANMVLARTTEALRADKQACKNIEAGYEQNEIHKIDSLFTYYMQFYNFRIDYSFEVIKPNSSQPVSFTNDILKKDVLDFFPTQPACYQRSLEAVANNNGFELKLIFPEKRQFILAEMGTPFITSVILIVVVLVLFWRTVHSLIKEKKIAEHTTDFLNNMTHEFKTPLTNIALAGKMMVKDTIIKQEDKIKHYSGIILDENEKLRLQVEQVLSMTALERGEIPLQKTELDFHQLIRDALKSMSLQMENKEGTVDLQLNAYNFVVMGDKTHLINALCNLMDNAVKYAKEKPELTIRTADNNQNLVVVVSDKGIGIDKEFQKSVFEKFYRVSTGNVHDVKGFGLGLAYVKKIIELHGGFIELESEKGQGVTVTITLPHV